MRVLMLLLEDFPGSDNRVQRQCRSLRAAGHDVTVFCAKGLSTETSWEGVSIERSTVQRVKAGSLPRRLYDYIAFPLSARRFVARRGREFDVIQVANPPDWLVWAAGSWRSASTERRLVLDLHEPMPELMAAKASSGLAVRVLRSLEARSCAAADAVLVVTEAFRRRLAEAHGVHAILVRNGVDTRAFVPVPPAVAHLSVRPLRVIYAGTLAQRFGVDVAADAVRIARTRGLDVVLDVFGDGDAAAELLSRYEGLDGSPIRFYGQVPADALAARLADYGVGIVPYRDSSFMRIAESSKAYEYAIKGVPVICSDIPALRAQLGEDSALYVEPGDPEALCRALEEIAADVRGAHQRALCASRSAALSSWDCIEREYLVAVTGCRQ